MASVNFPANVGGDGSTVTDDSSVTTGLANGGFRTRLLPMFTNIVNIANWILGTAGAAGTSATNALNAASAASTSAGNANTSAGAASTSAANALASANAAAASSPLPSSTGNSGKILTNNGTVASWTNTMTAKLHLTAMDTASTALGSVSGTVNIDCSLAQAYSLTPTATTTLAFINPPTGNTSQVILLKVTNGGAFTLNFPAGSKYPGGALGTLTSSGVDWLGVAYDAGLTAWVVFVLGKAVA